MGYFGLPSDSPASQPEVLVAVPPAVHGPLNEATLRPQTRIELRQGPPNCIALGLIVQTVSFVLVFATTRTWIHAILILELGTERVHIDRLDIAPDAILHLYPISRVLKSNPLYPIAVLSDHKGSRGRNWPRRSI